MTFAMSELNGTKLVIEEEVWQYCVIITFIVNNSPQQEDEDVQTMTVKEIEEQKRNEKVLQQKKVM